MYGRGRVGMGMENENEKVADQLHLYRGRVKSQKVFPMLIGKTVAGRSGL